MAPIDDRGALILEEFERLVTERTRLVAVSHISNALGTVNPVGRISEIARSVGAVVVVDGAQGLPHGRVDVQDLGCDFYAASGHKMYGPKGVGALFVRRRPRVVLEAQMHGGGHERGMRSGTLNVPSIVGLGEACRLAQDEMAEEAGRTAALRDHLQQRCRRVIDDDVMVAYDLREKAG